MSPRKLTEDDKQEILQLYRSSEATTSTLATRYEVSSSTISRFLKNQLSSTEYEDLIQQKRLARTPRGEKTKAKAETTKSKKSAPKTKPVEAVEPEVVAESNTQTVEEVEPEVVVESDSQTVEPEVVAESDPQTVEPAIVKAETETQSKPLPTRRRRRRSSAPEPEEVNTIEPQEEQELETEKPAKLVIETKTKDTPQPAAQAESDRTSKSSSLILKNDRIDDDDDEDDDDDDDDEVDIITLKEMLGEDLEDINEDEDDEDEDWEDDEEIITYSRRGSDYSDIQILPLSQASFPRTCYLVIDRSAELIVKPLADFADLGEIPQEEVTERTLPVFDNHRIAKRFSHRRERVIKVPDGRMLQKTSQYLQEKGITRLLIDGQIYSLSN